jgi:uracil-DNA glycosylase
MNASGPSKPEVYFLGEAPGKDEDIDGEPFVGKSGKLLRSVIPKPWRKDRIRMNNVVRTRPPNNRDPNPVEIECCKPSIIKDIEKSAPVAIFGFGNVPLHWALNDMTGISRWRGRRVPVKIGNHTCWYYPILHPSYILHKEQEQQQRRRQEYSSEDEFCFVMDLEKAFREVEDGLPDPIVHTREDANEDIFWVTGSRSAKDVQRVIEWINSLYEEEVIGLDIETNVDPETGVGRPYKPNAKILSIALAGSKGSLAWAVDHKEAEWTREELNQIEDAFYEFLLYAKCIKAVQNVAYEMEWLAYFYGKKILRAGRWACTMSQAFIIDERNGALNLGFLTLLYFGINIKKISNINTARLADAEITSVLPYNAIDAKYHRLLFFVQEVRLENENLIEVYEHHYRRIPTMVLTQLKGLPINPERVEFFRRKYQTMVDKADDVLRSLKIVDQFRAQTGRTFNPAADKDVKHIFDVMLRMEMPKHDELNLEAADHPLADAIIAWRKPNKILSTYILPLVAGSPIVYENGTRIHPIISTCKVSTWRTSSESPNCFPPEVEVLTTEGWLKWPEVNQSSYLAQYNVEDGEISFTQPEKLICQNVSTLLTRIKTDLHIDIKCTENHRFVLLRRKRNQYPNRNPIKWTTATKFPNYFDLPQAGVYNDGNKSLRPSQIILVAAFQADAYWPEIGYIEWRLTRKRKQDRLREALIDEGISFNENPHKNEQISFYVPKGNVPEWLSSKRHYGSWLLDLSQETLQLLAKEVQYWDESFTNQNEFCTGNKTDADWVQILYTLTNQRAAIRSRASTSPNTLFVCLGQNNFSSTDNHTKIMEKYDGKVYCATMPGGTLIVRYNGLVSITGNSQNYPKRSSEGEGKEVRAQIEPEEYEVMVSFDYGQIQARNVAMESRDPKLVQYFWDRHDIHTDWCNNIAEEWPKWVPGGPKKFQEGEAGKKLFKLYRDYAKNQFVFPSFFGAQPKSIGEGLGIPNEAAQNLHKHFWDEFPDIKDWHIRLKEEYYRTGYVTGCSGFRRRAPIEVNKIINAPIQADEAIIVCDAMARLSEIDVQASMEIHDDLTFIWRKDDVDYYAEIVIREMLASPFKWINVPIAVEMSIGPNWASLEEVGKFESDTFKPNDTYFKAKEAFYAKKAASKS